MGVARERPVAGAKPPGPPAVARSTLHNAPHGGSPAHQRSSSLPRPAARVRRASKERPAMADQPFRRHGGPTSGMLTARPGPLDDAPAGGWPVGEHRLGLGGERDGLLYVPPASSGRPAPLALLFHGAGGDARMALELLVPLADDAGLILLAPDSRGATWDVLRGGYGPDVAFIDQALAHVFRRYAVAPGRIAVGGFSDGASYALSLGIMNGTLFTHVLAYSPGFMAPLHQEGEPRIFISHGQADEVLPIDVCSRRLVPLLEGAGYTLRYREFPGPHTVPPAIARESISWLIS